jgi:hypothetical protein
MQPNALPREGKNVRLPSAMPMKGRAYPFFMDCKVAIVNSFVTVFELNNLFTLHIQKRALPLTGWWEDKIWNFIFFLLFTIV